MEDLCGSVKPFRLKMHMKYIHYQSQFIGGTPVHRVAIAFIFACLCLTSVYAQSTGKNDIRITFTTGVYTTTKPDFYNRTGNGVKRNDAARRLISSFNVSTLEAYQQFFREGECHVTQETFNNWKANIGQTQPIILASFTLLAGAEEFCLIKYALQHDNLEFISGQLLKKTNDTWYFCGLDENVERTDLIMFFSLIKEEIFIAVKKNRVSASQQGCLFNKDNLDGQELINQYFDKYKPQSPCHEALNLLFEDRIQSIDGTESGQMTHYDYYFNSSGLPKEDLAYLSNLLRSYNTEMALLHFSKLTGKPLQEIKQHIPKSTTHEK
jgi:hypothetical protein